MPDAAVLDVVQAYGDQMAAVRGRVLTYVQNVWGTLDNYHGPDIERFVRAVVPAVTGGQTQTAALTDAYLARVESVLLGKSVGPVGVPAQLVSDEAMRGVAADEVYSRTGPVVWRSLSEGSTLDDAAAVALQRALTMASTDLQLAKTHASRHILGQKDNVRGYRRTLTGRKACGLCRVAAAQLYHTGDLMPVHAHCGCGILPIYSDHDPGVFMDPDKFASGAVEDRFGTEHASAKRLVVNHHGEMGPVLGVRGQHFSGPTEHLVKAAETKVAKSAEQRVFANKNEATAWAKETFSDWTKKVTPAERQALNAYTGSDYRIMNDSLRGKKTPQLDYVNSVPSLKGELHSWNENLTRALHKAKTPEPMQVTRGGVFKGKDFKVGDTMRDEGFVSTTMSTFVPKGIKNDTIFTIDLPKDTKGAYIGAFTKMKAEAEFLMPPGAEFRITSVEQQGSKRLVKMELTAQDTEAKALKRVRTKR